MVELQNFLNAPRNIEMLEWQYRDETKTLVPPVWDEIETFKTMSWDVRSRHSSRDYKFNCIIWDAETKMIPRRQKLEIHETLEWWYPDKTKTLKNAWRPSRDRNVWDRDYNPAMYYNTRCFPKKMSLYDNWQVTTTCQCILRVLIIGCRWRLVVLTRNVQQICCLWQQLLQQLGSCLSLGLLLCSTACWIPHYIT